MAKDDKKSEEPAELSEDKQEEQHTEETSDKDDHLLEAKHGKQNPLQKLGRWASRHKVLAGLLLVLVVLGIILAIPATRYQALGLFIKRDFAVTVIDSETDKPISAAIVTLAGKSATTDADGKAVIGQIPVGDAGDMVVKKSYYQDFTVPSVLVKVDAGKNNFSVAMQATGRQVPVSVVNKINGKVLAGATIKANDTEAKTDNKGEATMVVSPDKKTVTVRVSANGYNDTTVELTVTEAKDNKNAFSLTPVGKVYFLSKKSGKIDVVKTNLDGTDRKVVVAGTGKEQDSQTYLVASHDWKYLVLQARRDGDKAKLHLIDTSNDKMITFDEGNAQFSLVGWQGHNFVYTVTRNNVKQWQSKLQALKSYNADTKTITTMRETAGIGKRADRYAQETISSMILTDDSVVYVLNWNVCCTSYYYNYAKKQGGLRIMEGKAGTKEARVVKSFVGSGISSLSGRLYKPNEIYFSGYNSRQEKSVFFEYENGVVKSADIDEESFYDGYPRFLLSPSGKTTFWSESRDGKNTFFIGNSNGENEEEVAELSEYSAIGWYTNDYLLVSKLPSELYIMPNEKNADKKSMKVSDYYRLNYATTHFRYY